MPNVHLLNIFTSRYGNENMIGDVLINKKPDSTNYDTQYQKILFLLSGSEVLEQMTPSMSHGIGTDENGRDVTTSEQY